jgi:AI-2E family transporter
MGTAKAAAFLIWCIVVVLMDNVLKKPLLLGRGVPVPIFVIFLSAIGGFMAMGIIGLFVGPIVLSVRYKLFLAWLDEDVPLVPTAFPKAKARGLSQALWTRPAAPISQRVLDVVDADLSGRLCPSNGS